jgi:hypothetical protein
VKFAYDRPSPINCQGLFLLAPAKRHCERRSSRREAIQSPYRGFWIAEPAIDPVGAKRRLAMTDAANRRLGLERPFRACWNGVAYPRALPWAKVGSPLRGLLKLVRMSPGYCPGLELAPSGLAAPIEIGCCRFRHLIVPKSGKPDFGGAT